MPRLKGKARKTAQEMKNATPLEKIPEKRETFDEKTEPFIFKDDGQDIDEDKRKTGMEKAIDFVRAKYFPDKTKNILADEDIQCLIKFDQDHPNYVNRKMRGEDMTDEEQDLFTKAEKYFEYIKYKEDEEIIGLEVINDPSEEMIADRFKEEGAEYLGGGQVLDSEGNAMRPADSIMTGKSSLPNDKVDELWAGAQSEK